MLRFTWLLVPALAIPLWAGDYAHEIASFRAQREASLRAPDGWTTVVGLVWLKPGQNRAGSNPELEVPLPASVPRLVGTFTLQSHHVEFRPAAGVNLPAQEMKDDNTEKPTMLSLGSVTMYVIRRGDKFGIRVKDSQAKARREFTHLRWYPVEPSWRIEGKFTAYAKPRTVFVDTVIPGLKEEDQAPGYVTFSKGGQIYRLEPVIDDGELFFIFRDRTSGKSTYAASRFLYAELPKDGKVLLDFNKATNPPCVFTQYATCPLPPPQNRLALAVTAGELMYDNRH
jgi:uncharacterized protein (DUF1684 family)